MEGLAGLRAAAARRPDQFPRTVTEKLLAYALGRRLEYYDRPAVRKIVRDAAASDYRWSSLDSRNREESDVPDAARRLGAESGERRRAFRLQTQA